jgi:hypothetical protein
MMIPSQVYLINEVGRKRETRLDRRGSKIRNPTAQPQRRSFQGHSEGGGGGDRLNF